MQFTGIAHLFGADVNTDEIIAARYLTTSDPIALAANLMEDARPGFVKTISRGDIIVAGGNFGCGSSREHAPQALARWGVRAIVGESFAEIFFSNATALGVPCVCVRPEAVQALMALVERDAEAVVSVDLESLTVRSSGIEAACTMPAAARSAFLAGTWDATALLTADFDAVRAAAARLPYIGGFRSVRP